jgi:hypothetical protein
MRRLLFSLLGVFLLIAAAAMLWMSFGPLPAEARTTGGILYTQPEVAQIGTANLEAVLDVQAGGQSAAVPVMPSFTDAVGANLAAAGQTGTQAVPPTVTPGEAAPGVPLTTNIVLNDTTGVAVVPLMSALDAVPDGQGGLMTSTSGYEQRVVELEWPDSFQIGRSDAVRIKLKMLAGGALQPVAEVAENEVIATPILITDRYDTHNAFVTATISAPDFEIESVSPARQALERGGEVEWRWTLESNEAQTAVISLGLAITWEPKPGVVQAALTDVPIWGQTLQVDVNYVFGLITVPQASIAGTALAVLGFIAQMPLLEKFLEIGLDILFGGSRRRRRKEEARRRKQQRRR